MNVLEHYLKGVWTCASKDHKGWLQFFQLVQNMALQKAFFDYLLDPRITVDTKTQTITVILAKLSFTISRDQTTFLHMIALHQRWSLLIDCYSEFRAWLLASQHIMAIQVQLAAEIDAKAQDALKTWLSRTLQSEIELTVSVCPELLGGMRLHYQDWVYDGSTGYQLLQMAAKSCQSSLQHSSIMK